MDASSEVSRSDPLESCTNAGEVLTLKVSRLVFDQTRRAQLLKTSSQNDIVEEIFSSLVSPIDLEIRRLITQNGTTTSENKAVDKNSPSTLLQSDRSHHPRMHSHGDQMYLYYYELMADHFAKNTSEAEEFKKCSRGLWSNVLFPGIFTMLLYKTFLPAGKSWENEVDGQEAVVSESSSSDKFSQLQNFNVFIKGASRLFSYDEDINQFTFAPIFEFMMNDILLNPDNSNISFQGFRSLLGSISRFYLYYDLDFELQTFINDICNIYGELIENNLLRPDEKNSPTKTRRIHKKVVEILVDEITLQIKEIKDANSLEKMLGKLRILKYVNMNKLTKNRIQILLNSYLSPGGPFFPPRAVRKMARKVMEFLFPRGKRVRLVIHSLFRLLHPFYWPFSLTHWIFTNCVIFVRLILGHNEDPKVKSRQDKPSSQALRVIAWPIKTTASIYRQTRSAVWKRISQTFWPSKRKYS